VCGVFYINLFCTNDIFLVSYDIDMHMYDNFNDIYGVMLHYKLKCENYTRGRVSFKMLCIKIRGNI
jgi:hypothetical protein